MLQKRWHCIAVVFIIAHSLSCGFPQSDGPRSIDISGKWKIIYSDDATIANPGYDDSGAGQIEIPGEWMDAVRKNDQMTATVWLRKSVHISDAYSRYNLMLELGEIGIADETYVNGHFIGGTGMIPSDAEKLNYRFAWKNPRHYHIPKAFINFNHANTIAVRAFSHVFNGMTGSQRIMEMSDGYPDRMFADYFPVLFNFFAISLAAVSFLLSMVQFLTNRDRIVYLLFALIVLSAIILNLCVTNVPVYMNGLGRFKALMFAYISISVYISLALQDIFNIRFRYSTAALLLVYVINTAGILAAHNTRILINYCGTASVITVLGCQIYTSAIFIMAVTRDLRRYWLMLFGFPVVFSAFRNAYYLLTMQFNIVYLTIFLHVPVLLLVAILYIFYDYEYQKGSGESLYHSLLRKSQKLQRDLDKARKVAAKPVPHDVIHSVIEYLDANFSETYNRKELSNRFGLNQNYMVQLFKRTTGETISNYINMKRIESAKNLLRGSDYKIIDIAYHVGFENYTHFHRLFKRVTGMTPREFRIYSED